MTMLGLDYSAGRPSGAAVRGAGYGFVARYLDNGFAGRANLTAAELADMRANGVAVPVVWESAADRATAGRDAGVADARAADAAVNAVGAAGLPMYFAVDFDIPDYAPATADPRAKLGPVAAYFDGVVSVLGVARTGVYGGYWAVKRVLDAGLATYAWQAAAWSGNNVDTRIHLFQRIGSVLVGGVDCDVNESQQDDFGQHPQGANMSGFDNNDVGVLMRYNVLRPGGDPNKASDYVNVGQALVAAFDGKSELDAVKAQVAALQTPAAPVIDLDALAAKVAANITLTGTVQATGKPTT